MFSYPDYQFCPPSSSSRCPYLSDLSEKRISDWILTLPPLSHGSSSSPLTLKSKSTNSAVSTNPFTPFISTNSTMALTSPLKSSTPLDVDIATGSSSLSSPPATSSSKPGSGQQGRGRGRGTKSPTPIHSRAMRRVLSQGSNGSNSSGTPGIMTLGQSNTQSSSSASGSAGVRTPKARRTKLPDETKGNGALSSVYAVPGGSGSLGLTGTKKDQDLAQNLEDLQVKSPPFTTSDHDVTMEAGPSTSSSLQIQQPSFTTTTSSSSKPQSNKYRDHDRSFSSSTDSSSSENHPQPPSGLGSMYGAEGFEGSTNPPQFITQSSNSNSSNPTYGPSSQGMYGVNIPKTESPELGINPNSNPMTAAAAYAAQVAAADEAIKHLNGTSTVYNGLNQNGTVTPNDFIQPYALPKSYSTFVKPQNRSQLESPVTRQSSTSSSTTEASSTSSEESDLCIPTLEWVTTNSGRRNSLGIGNNNNNLTGSGGGSGQNWSNGQFGGNNIPGGYSGSGASRNNNGYPGQRNSPARMPPPTKIPTSSPRLKNNSAITPNTAHPSGSFPSGLSYQQAHPATSSALPKGTNPDEMEDDDDDQTIGQRERDQSPSSNSSQSNRSGLNLLWRAATHSSSSETGDPTTGKMDYKPPIPIVVPNSDNKGKRKAGAEAVDQWRNSGIPTGVEAIGSKRDNNGKKGGGGEINGNGIGTSGLLLPDVTGSAPPKKRRRSSSHRERDKEDINGVGVGNNNQLTLNHYSSETFDDNIDPTLRSANEINKDRNHNSVVFEDDIEDEDEDDTEYKDKDDSEPDDGENEGDSEYGGESSKRKSISARGSRKRGIGSGGGGAGGARGRVSISSTGAGPSGRKSGIGASGGGTGRKKTDSPSGANKGGRRSSGSVAVPAGGVQCDYVNPLPPYNRCQDVFTRKYDLPRHMARHGRREGELVLEGRLAEEDAKLWLSIRDKPKVTCGSCGESFTRMDALKRHQAKQHHH